MISALQHSHSLWLNLETHNVSTQVLPLSVEHLLNLYLLDGANVSRSRNLPSEYINIQCVILLIIILRKGKKSSGIATLKDVNNDDDSDDEEDPGKREKLYAGGERS